MTGRRVRRSAAALLVVPAASTLVAWGFWTAPGAGSAPATSGSLAAAAVGAAASGFNAVTVTWGAQASLEPASADNSAITYAVERRLDGGAWAPVAGGDCAGVKPHGATSCIDGPPATGSYDYRVVATYRTWTATSANAGPVAFTLETDAVPPTNAVTLSGVTGGAFKSGTTVYYRGAAAGSFTLTNALTDGGPSGPAWSETAALSGTATGWTHSPSRVSTPTGGPYVSSAFSWSAPTSSSPSATVTGSDVAGNTTATALTFTNDAVAPAGGSVDAAGLGGTGGRYSPSTGLSIAFSAGTDAGSGLATGAQLQRATASLSDGACGTFSGYTQVGADDPVSPVADTVLGGQDCYRYRYVVLDRVGNEATFTSPDIKIDTTAPAAPTFAFSAFTNAFWDGSTLHYRRSAGAGAFTVTAGATDATSGIASYAFPTLPAGWTGTAGALGVRTYSWSVANPTAPTGAQNATATNNAGLSSPPAGFPMASDVTAPTGGTVTHANGYVTSPSVSVSFTRGTDGSGAGVDATSGLLQRAEATLSAGTCGTYGGFATVAGGTDPASPFADTGVASGKCYQYRYLVSDNVGNQATYTGAAVAKVDSAAPTLTRSTAAEATGTVAQHVHPGSSYHLYAEVPADPLSGTAAVAGDVSALTSGQTGAALATGAFSFAGLSYTWRTAALTANATLAACSYTPTVTATDTAGNSATANAATVMVDRDLLNEFHVRVDGVAASDQAGAAVANAGDVNGDGRLDALVGAPKADHNTRANSGSAYVVFGQATTTTIDLNALGTRGYRIDGAAATGDTGFSVANAGDVNGDGRPDALVGATLAAKAYVVFGKATTTAVDLNALGTQGYTITGAAGTSAGYSVANAGDVNADGRPDAIVGASLADNTTRTDSGTAYVVFGKTTTTAITLASMTATQGYAINGAAAGANTGFSVAGAGDVNGDARADVLVGGPKADNNTRTDSGSAYLVFGKTTGTAIDLNALGTGGYRIDGAATLNDTGYEVSSAGDVNGDARPDALVAAALADNNSRTDSGSAYVVFGKTTTTTIDLNALGTGGYRIDGAAAGANAGASVASAGDVNADGRPDAIVGAPLADNNARTDSGSAYVVFGKSTTTSIDLNVLGTQGYRIDGAAGSNTGSWVEGAGDANADGRPDILIGARLADNTARTDSGSAFTFLSPACT